MAARRHLIVDLSNNNEVTDLRALKRAGIEGCWHKVSEGGSFVDGDWKERSQKLRNLGIRVGGYHFARPVINHARSQAQFFCKLLGQIQRRDLAPVLDFEVNDQHLRPVTLVAWAREFNHEVHRITDVWPIFYSFPSFIETIRPETVIGRGLWLASFGRNDGKEHPFFVPPPFKKALAHQFASQANVAGISGDCDLSSAPRIVPLLARGWVGL